MLDDVGLVLEGGGMRGVYTAGVLECFLENEVFFPYIIGVSAGASNAASYLSKQKGRNHTVNIEYITDHRYISWRNFFKKRQFFGMDFIFDDLPNKLAPYDYEAFHNNPAEFVVGTTDCHTGEAVYFTRKDYGKELNTILKASCSLPFIAQEINFKDKILLDGGISDPIPIKKAQADGFKKNIVILTRNQGYQKKPSRFNFLVNRKYPQYRGLQWALQERYRKYNETIHYLEEEAREGSAMIIRPTVPIDVGRMERNPDKLEKLFNIGYQDAKQYIKKISDWI